MTPRKKIEAWLRTQNYQPVPGSLIVNRSAAWRDAVAWSMNVRGKTDNNEEYGAEVVSYETMTELAKAKDYEFVSDMHNPLVMKTK